MSKQFYALLVLTAAVLAGCATEEKKAEVKAEEQLVFSQLPFPADSLARYPHLLADEENNRLWMSWMVQHNSDSASLWMAEMDGATGIWKEPELVHAGKSLMVNWADYPHLLPNGKQPGVLFLQIADPTAPYAYHVMYKEAGKAAQRLHSDSSATEHGFVSAAALPGGRQGIVWLDGNKYAGAEDAHGHGHGGEMTLRFRSLAADGKLQQATEVDGRTCDCCNTAMVATPEGAIVFYRDRSEEEIRDIYYTRYAAGSWSEPRPVHNDGWEMRACPVNGPAADARGAKVAVAWFTGAGGNNRVQLRFSEDAGESWGPVLVADSLQPMGRVGVKLLSGGSALLSWLDGEGRLVLRQVNPEGQMGEIQPLADSLSSRKSGFPQLVRLNEKVYLAWTQPEPYTQLKLVEGKLAKK
ncbi:hypothetical protein [Cesiribacter sp. SM1]|uniref:hypothetical protein n=1 Tax=Cesiribacter sp. SM1 TaxID=2861196 RepID=UPI001CD61A3B|nr:hypothetical protein [Cesiribacter sp. SM1]